MCSWDLRLRNGDGLWAVEGLCKSEGAGFPTRICLVSVLEMGAESEEKAQQKACYRAGGETGGWIWRSVGRGEDLHSTYQLP